jgi:catechol 2,3-dioxygenase-like lactoylglutathione lyase family enzyme
MNIQGIDHITIGVRDLDRAIKFFSRLLDTQFIELTGPFADASPMRCVMSVEKRVELVEPKKPLPEDAFPQMKRMAAVLEKSEAVLFAVAFRVKDAETTVKEAEKQGVRIETRFDIPDLSFWGGINVKELLTNDEDMLGINMKFVEYENI